MTWWEAAPVAQQTPPAAGGDWWTRAPAVPQPLNAAPPAPAAAPEPDAGSAQPAATPQAPAAQVPTQGWGRFALDTAGQAMRGARRGAANVMGLPVDVMSWFLNQGYNLGAGVADEFRGANDPLNGVQPLARDPIRDPVGGSDFIDRALGGFGAVPDMPEPRGPVQRFARRTGEEIGAAALPIAGAAGAVQAGVNPAANMITRMFVQPYVANPTAFAQSQLAGSTAAGLGASVINEATRAAGFDRDKGSVVGQLGDLIGSFGGAGLFGLGNAVVNRAAEAWRMFRDGVNGYHSPVVDRGAADTVANLFRRPFDSDYSQLADEIAAGRRPGTAVPGYRETLADRTQDPVVAAATLQRSAGPRAPDYTLRNTENANAIDQAMTGARPQGNAGALIEAVIAERDAAIAGATSEANRLAAEADRLAAGLAPQMSGQERGQTIRAALAQALDSFTGPQAQNVEALRARLAQALEDLRPQMSGEQRGQAIRGGLSAAEEVAQGGVREAYNRAGVGPQPVDSTTVSQALDAVTESLPLAERALVPRSVIEGVAAPGRASGEVSVTGLVDEFGKPIMRPAEAPEPMTVEQLTALRTRLMNHARALRGDPRAEAGGADAARVTDKYTAAVEQLIQQHLDPDTAANLTAARETAKARAESFGRSGDPVAEVLAQNSGGVPRVPAARVPGRIVSSEAEGPLERVLSEAGTPDVRAAIRDELVSRMGRDPTPEAATELLQTYGRTLEQFPALRDQLQRAIDAAGAARGAEADLAARRSDFAGGSRLVADSTATRPDGIPTVPDETIARQAVSPAGTRDLDALLRQADTPQVRAALRDEILSRAAKVGADQNTLQQFVREYGDTLSRFPGLDQELMKLVGARGQAQSAATVATETERTLTTPGRSVAGTVGSFGTHQAHEAISAIAKSTNPAAAADELMGVIGRRPEAVAGARRAFWDFMESKTRSRGETTATVDGVQPWRPEALNRLLDDPAVSAVAERLYRDNPEHLERIKEIAQAIRHTQVQARTRAPGSSGTGQILSGNVLTPEAVLSRVYAAETGRTSYTFAATSVISVLYRRAMRIGRAGAIDRTVDEALLNPDFAAALLRDNNPVNRAALRRAVQGRSLNRYSEIFNILNDHDDDPVERAVRE